MSRRKKPTGIVYSTDPDFTYQFDQTEEQDTLPPARQDLRLWLEKNHRGGKQVVVIKGFKGKVADLESLARELKNKCACGGTVKDGEVILQGDVRQKAMQFLLAAGYKCKTAGA